MIAALGPGETRGAVPGGTGAAISPMAKPHGCINPYGRPSETDSWLLSIGELDPGNLERATQRCDRWFVGGHDSRRSLETLDGGE